MTKGEVLKKYGLTMLRRDLGEEADENFEKFIKMLSENFEDLSNKDKRKEQP